MQDELVKYENKMTEMERACQESEETVNKYMSLIRTEK